MMMMMMFSLLAIHRHLALLHSHSFSSMFFNVILHLLRKEETEETETVNRRFKRKTYWMVLLPKSSASYLIRLLNISQEQGNLRISRNY